MDRVLTRKGAVVGLAIVTVGVLIALSFDGVRGWIADRTLVAEARTNIASEIRDNKSELDGFLTTIPMRYDELETLRSIAETLLAGKPNTLNEASLGFDMPSLTSASRSSAEMTGAFGLMDYSEVKQYAEMLMRPALSRTALIEVAKPPQRELEVWIQDLDALGAQLLFLEQIGKQLSAGYAKVLQITAR